MKNLLVLCLSMFLTLGLCSVSEAANGAADKAKGNADRAGAAKDRVEKAADQEKAKVKEKIAENAKDANEVKGDMEKRAKGKAGEKTKEVKADAEKEMKGRTEKVEKGADKAKDAVEGHAKGKGHMQQSSARERQLIHEQEKHKSRMARLERIKELAQKDGDAKTLERVDKLIANENERFVSKTAKLEGKAAEAVEKAAEKKQ
jgi:hypothetical protein